MDLSHQFAIYRKTTRFLVPRDGNGPDECSVDRDSENSNAPWTNSRSILNASQDPRVSPTPRKNFARPFLEICRAASACDFSGRLDDPVGTSCRFTFSPRSAEPTSTAAPPLSSYQDYRFRAPNVLFVRESFEHSIGSLPLGFTFMADEGKVALTRGGLGSNPWIHSFSAGSRFALEASLRCICCFRGEATKGHTRSPA